MWPLPESQADDNRPDFPMSMFSNEGRWYIRASSGFPTHWFQERRTLPKRQFRQIFCYWIWQMSSVAKGHGSHPWVSFHKNIKSCRVWNLQMAVWDTNRYLYTAPLLIWISFAYHHPKGPALRSIHSGGHGSKSLSLRRHISDKLGMMKQFFSLSRVLFLSPEAGPTFGSISNTSTGPGWQNPPSRARCIILCNLANLLQFLSLQLAGRRSFKFVNVRLRFSGSRQPINERCSAIVCAAWVLM